MLRGVIRVGDEIEIKPGIKVRRGGKEYYEPLTTEVVSIKFGDRSFSEARPGGLVALGTRLDPSLTKADSLVGNVCGRAGTVPDPVTQVSIRYSLLERVPGTKEQVRVEPLKPKETIMLTAGVAVTLASVDSISKDIASLTLRRPIVAWNGMRVAISKQVLGRWRLVGWGHID